MVKAKNLETSPPAPVEAKVNGFKKKGRKRQRESLEGQAKKKIKVCLSCPDITNGVVLSVGTGDIGQLGLGPDVEEKSRPCIVPDLKQVVSISAGGLHSLALTKEGKIFSWGCNDEGGLGRVTTTEEENFEVKEVTGLDGRIVQISAGDCHSAALTSDGRVFAWGSFRDNSGPLGFVERGTIQKSPREIMRTIPIVKITSANNHLALLSQDGRVFTLGCGECGQLGRLAECFSGRDRRNKGYESLLEPLPLKLFNNRKAVTFDDVWAGGYVTFVRAKDSGDMYGFGLNNYCQLGNEDTNMKFQPQLLKAFRGKEWVGFSAGQHHSIAVDKTGIPHAMGRNDYGRLGLGEKSPDATIPTEIKGITGKAVEVSAGECVSFIVTEEGLAYAFGMGTNNQLGQGDDDDRFVPSEIKGKQLLDKKIVSVKSGGQHTLLLAVPK